MRQMILDQPSLVCPVAGVGFGVWCRCGWARLCLWFSVVGWCAVWILLGVEWWLSMLRWVCRRVSLLMRGLGMRNRRRWVPQRWAVRGGGGTFHILIVTAPGRLILEPQCPNAPMPRKIRERSASYGNLATGP